MIREISKHKRAEENLRASSEQMRDFAAHVDAAVEEERNRVAREIHDELGQALTALKLDLAWIQRRTPRDGAVRKKMVDILRDVDKTIQGVRRISSELRPLILDDLGLIAAIEWQLNQFRKRSQVRTQFLSNVDSINLSPAGNTAVFRVVQEALTNIMRHAKATRVRIVVDQAQDSVRISIADNGVGMTVNPEQAHKTMGIVGMKERIARLSGDLKILSTPGKGTRLEIVVPVEE